MNTGVIGLGAMGAGMARNLAAAGLLTAVWNRTTAKAGALAADLGVTVAADPADLANRCEVIITCVSRDADVLEVVQALQPALTSGRTVVDCSTIAVDTARQAAGLVSETRARFVDAPVSGGREGAEAGQLVFMVGGEADTVDALAPVFQAMGKQTTHMGPVGSGQATKAVNQIMAAGINQAVTEALAFGQASGLEMAKVIEVVGGGAAGNWFLQKRGASMVDGVFEPGFKLALHYKDLSICKRMSAEMGVALPIIEMTLKHYERLMEAGFGEDDISALFRAKRALFENGNLKSL